MRPFKRLSNDVLRVLVLVILALVIVPNVFGQGTDEAIVILVPTNDNFVNAEPLVLNSTQTTVGSLFFAGTEAAELSDSDLTNCLMSRTVWYRFVAPFTGQVSFSTMGSYIMTQTAYSQDTVIAVYSGTTLANLIEQGCGDQASGSLGEVAWVNVTNGTTYYVRVGLYPFISDSVTGGSYSLTSVVAEAAGFAPVLLFNGNFSVPIESLFGGWTVKNAFNGDGIDAGKFKFVGGPLESTKIVQKASWLTGTMLARVSHLLKLVVGMQTVSGTPNLKIVLTVLYSDGTPPSKRVLKQTEVFNGTKSVAVFFTSPNVSKVKVVIGNKASSGSITVDDVSLDYDGALFREAAALALPLP